MYNGRYGVVTDSNGLYYMRARYYNVDIKRFINQDVVEGNITNSPSLNKYAYCQGNPVSMFDPFGLSPKIDWGAIGHGVLDLLGMVPVVGALADIANGLWYMSEGDYFSAASSFVSSVPGLGDIAGGIAKAITGCTKYAKAFKFATRLASNIGNFALGAYQTATQIGNLWDKYVTQGKPWGEESLGEFLGAAFTGVSTVFSAKGVADDIANYKNTKYDILTSQCFVEGTLVVTKDGDKPIEEIQAGDLVYSTNPETGESEYKEVVRTFRKETDILIHIFVNDDEIETTPVHPFWVDGEWVAAKDLREGDELTLADGSTATVTKTYGEQLDEPVIVYNFEVEDFHTYYVTDTGVLVHNANGGSFDSCSVSSKSKSRTNWGEEHGKGNTKHNNAIEDELDFAHQNGASSIRKNKVQVDVDENRVYYDGKHYIKPDASYVMNGKRYNTNYVSNPNSSREVEREIKAYLNMCKSDPQAYNRLIFRY